MNAIRKTKYMLLGIICILSIRMTYITISASEQSDETERLIEKAKETYYNDKGVDSTEDLTYEQVIDLGKQIKIIKDQDSELKSLMKETNARATSALQGSIFVTGDSKTMGFRHGHAGIGANEVNAVIEANPGDGVALYRNRIQGYWSKVNSSIMSVRGASSNQYANAFRYANNKLGKTYAYNVYDGESAFFCSELVSRAWYSSGISIGFSHALPADIYIHSNTYAVLSYGTGY